MKGPCGWARDGIVCTHFGLLKKGFCPYHYAILNTDVEWYRCQCNEPIVKQVMIFGYMTFTDVLECGRCGLAILT